MTMHQCSCGPLLLLLSVALCHVVGAKQVILTNADDVERRVDLDISTIVRDNEYFHETEDQFLQFQQEGPLPSRRGGQVVLTTSFKASDADGPVLYYSLGHIEAAQSMWVWNYAILNGLISLPDEMINPNYSETVIDKVTNLERGVFVNDNRDSEQKTKLLVASTSTTLKTNFHGEQAVRGYKFDLFFDSYFYLTSILYGLDYQDAKIRLMSSPSSRGAHLPSGDGNYGKELCIDKLACQQISKGWQIITCRLLDASSGWVTDRTDPTKMVSMSIMVGNKLVDGNREGLESLGWENIVEAKVAASEREWTVTQMMYAKDQPGAEDEPAPEGQNGDYYTATLRVKYNVPDNTSVTCIIVEPLYGKIHGTETPRRAVYHLHAEPPPPRRATCEGITGRITTLRELATTPATPRQG